MQRLLWDEPAPFNHHAKPAPLARANVSVPAKDRKRVETQADRILALLREGPRTSADLAAAALKYTCRIEELRKAGHEIECRRISGGTFLYTLIKEAPCSTSAPPAAP